MINKNLQYVIIALVCYDDVEGLTEYARGMCMQLYKILLVDDEEEIRKGIIKKIKWEELGFVVVGEAENGIEALDIIDKTMPDVVITDIRMPFMDGIKLAENIKYRYPTNKVIVLSGFDDFEYAQEAIKLGVIRYILKPINSIEFTELLKEVKHLLDEEIRSKNDIETLKINYKKSLPLLKERFLNHWIEDYVSDEFIEENIHLLDFDIDQRNLALAVIRPDELVKKEKDIKNLKNKNLLKMAIFNICEEVVQEHNLGTIFMKINEMVVIIPLKENETVKSSSRIAVALEQIRIAVQKYLDTTVTIGVGNICTNKSMLYKTYASALAALDYTMPLYKLQKSMKLVEQGNFDIRIEEGGEYVVRELSKTFNKMVVRTRELMDEIVKEQDDKRKKELDVLQSQINPHFLYNTLDSIIWLVEDERITEATQMITALSRFFRIGISSGRTVITVREELEHARNYLAIQKIRYKNKFDYKIEADPRTLEAKTIKLILQPLIENALYHGIEYIQHKGEILIEAYIEDNNLIYKIRDNGVGMTEETKNRIFDDDYQVKTKGSGVGVKNVNQRIKLYYGPDYGMRIESELEEGTTVYIKMPLRYE